MFLGIGQFISDCFSTLLELVFARDNKPAAVHKEIPPRHSPAAVMAAAADRHTGRDGISSDSLYGVVLELGEGE